MLDLHERLHGVIAILNASTRELEMTDDASTGFVAAVPEYVAKAVLELLKHTETTKSTLDLGCGNGCFALLAAAAGFPSYGIDINPRLVKSAQQNYELAVAKGYIAPATPCVFIVGDMIPPAYSAHYDAYRKLYSLQEHTMPIGPVVEDAYGRLPVRLETVEIIYCWSWPTQSRFLYNLLCDATLPSAIFVLPSYEHYIRLELPHEASQNTLILSPLAVVESIFIGRRAA